MVSRLPWHLDENDPSIIYDARGNVIAKNYKFLHVDDFEAICKLVTCDSTGTYVHIAENYIP